MKSQLAVIIGGHLPFQGALCEQSCRSMGLQVFRYANGQTWPGNYRDGKTLPQLECVKNLPAQFSHMLFTDSADTLAIAGETEILSKYEAIGRPGVLISGEKNCHPDAGLAPIYPPSVTGWKYLNSGGWIGTRESVIQCLSWCASTGIVDDQRAWTHGYLSGAIPVKVDSGCVVFQTCNRQAGELIRIGMRIRNNRTGTFPCVIHWPGPWRSDALLNLIYSLGPQAVKLGEVAMAAGYAGASRESYA